MTCEHCGADAVDASGVCQVCGWRAGSGSASLPNPADAQAETHEADIPQPVRRASTARNVFTDAPATPPATPAPRSGPRSGAYGGAAPTTRRYCGTCGEEVHPDQQFCGQCGTPVADYDEADAPRTLATSRRSTHPPLAYDDDDEVWSPADQDAPTEQFIPPYSRPNPPYRQSGVYGPGAYVAGTPGGGTGMSREMRIVLGIVCILGALASGAGAIVLAFAH